LSGSVEGQGATPDLFDLPGKSLAREYWQARIDGEFPEAINLTVNYGSDNETDCWAPCATVIDVLDDGSPVLILHTISPQKDFHIPAITYSATISPAGRLNVKVVRSRRPDGGGGPGTVFLFWPRPYGHDAAEGHAMRAAEREEVLGMHGLL
jgi:hypothetical protein